MLACNVAMAVLAAVTLALMIVLFDAIHPATVVLVAVMLAVIN